MRIEIARLHSELDATMIYVTHDQVEAMTMADKIVVLRAGLVEQVGSPLELYHHPCNLFVAGFIGSPKMNFINTTVSAVDASGVTVALPAGESVKVPCKHDGMQVGDKVTFGVRPEDFLEEGGDAKLAGTVFVVERLGGETFAYVKVDSGEIITAQLGGKSPIRVNDKVALGINAQTTHLFSADELALERLDRAAFSEPGRTVHAAS
jgi:multiple sugar transport system ATP-binding protein